MSSEPPAQNPPVRPTSDSRNHRTRRNNQDAVIAPSAQTRPSGNRRRARRVPGEDLPAGPSTGINHREQKQSNGRGRTGDTAAIGVDGSSSANARPGRRGAKFNPGLTDPASPNSAPPSSPKTDRPHKPRGPENDDLASTLIHSLRTPPYPDCPICFSAIHPAQSTWSCSPSIPINSIADADETGNAGAQPRSWSDSAHCFWKTFHVKCIRVWAL